MKEVRTNDVAVIGMSGIFPEANDLNQFHLNLYEGKDCIKDVSVKRRELIHMDPKQEYMRMAFIEDIEFFDHAYFNISNKEADYMSPEQRLSLELAAETFLDAGYSIKSMAGKNCGVFASSSDNEYESMLKTQTSLSYIGSLKSMLTGKIAYYFDLHGPNMIIDTGCSSTLVCVHEACKKLIRHEIDYALAGGLTICLELPEGKNSDEDVLGIASKDGRCKSFDARADGTGLGEGGGYVLLKRLDDAKRDRDHIYGVIRGSAINSDGVRCSSVTTPGIEGQREAIIKAWEEAGIDQNCPITEIEAHGTGTKLGDPIETTSAKESLAHFELSEEKVLLGSVKSSIGHLGFAAGIAGLIKVLLGFKYHVYYPLTDFKEPNPLIDFKHSPLKPVTQPILEKPGEIRTAGINSFGFSGTNAHIVVQSYQDKEEKKTKLKEVNQLVKISAKSEHAFTSFREKIKQCLEAQQTDINNGIYTLNTGRDDEKYRRMYLAGNLTELLKQLEQADHTKKKKELKVVLVLTGEEQSDTDYGFLKREYPLFAEYAQKPLKEKADLPNHIAGKGALIHFLEEIGIKPDLVMADEDGKQVINFVHDKITSKELSEKLCHSISPDLSPRVKNKIEELREKEDLLIINLGGNKISDSVGEFCAGRPDELKQLIAFFYNSGRDIVWDRFYYGTDFKKVSLPGYCFDRTRHWLDLSVKSQAEQVENERIISDNGSKEIKTVLKEIWKNVLECDEVQDDDDFFELGGNSLLITMLTEEIEQALQVEIDVDEIYDYDTIEKQEQLIVERQKPAFSCPLNSMQSMILSAQENRPDRGRWNLALALRAAGPLDVQKFCEAQKYLVSDHQILGSVLSKTTTGPVFKRDEEEHSSFKVIMDFVDKEKELTQEELEKKEALIRECVRKEALTAMELYESPLMSTYIYQVSEQIHYILIKFHHLIADGWSLGLLFDQLCSYYRGENIGLQKQYVQYSDYAAYEAETLTSIKGREHLNYWKNEMKDFRYQIELSAKREEEKGNVVHVEFLLVDGKTTNRLREFTKQKKASIFHVLLLTYHLTLMKIYGNNDSCIGMMTANRTMKKYTETIGMLARVLPSRLQLKEERSVGDMLGEIKKKSAFALEHQICSALDIMGDISDSQHPAFDELIKFLIVYQNFGSVDLDLNGVKLSSGILNERSSLCPIAMIVYESEMAVMSSIEYDPCIYEKKEILAFIQTFLQTLTAVLDEKEIDIIVGQMKRNTKEGELIC